MSLSDEMPSIADQSLHSLQNFIEPLNEVDAELESKISFLKEKMSVRMKNNEKVKYIFSVISPPEFSFHFGRIYKEFLALLDGHKKYSGLRVVCWFENAPNSNDYPYNYPTGSDYTDVIDCIYTFLK